jgi:pimeloyl-ACP methyl ester carboxylesterase
MHVLRHHTHAEGPPVILVHGAPDRGKNFAKVVHLLPDLRITTYDRRGYGGSVTMQPPSNGFGDQARDLVALLDGTPSIVCGQSAGGLVAMMAATLAPELFLSLGLWEPPTVWMPWWPRGDHSGWLPTWVACDRTKLGELHNRELLGNEVWDALPDRTKELLRAEGDAFHFDLASQLGMPYDPAEVRCPSVVGCGALTNEFMIQGSRRLAQELRGEFWLVDGAAHVAHLASPPVWADLVRRAVELARP